MSQEQRANRASVLDQRMVGGRGTGERTPTYRGEMLHYSDEYGASMDDAHRSILDKGQEEFKTAVKTDRDTLATDRANVDTAYKEQRSAIDSASFSAEDLGFKSYDDYVKEKGTPVRIFDEQTLLGTYYLPTESAQSYINSLEEAGHDYTGIAEDDIGGYWVNVKGYGKEIHHPIHALDQESRTQYAALQAQQVSGAKDAFNLQKSTASSGLEREYGTTVAGLDAREGKINEAVTSNQNKLNTIRNKYSKKLESMKDTIDSLFK